MRTLLAVFIVGVLSSPADGTRDSRPPRSDCTENLKRCLDTRIAKNCKACFDLCKGQGRWPDKAGGGTIECRWWDHE